MTHLVEIELPDKVVASQVDEIQKFLDVIDRKLQSFIIVCNKVEVIDSVGLGVMLTFLMGA